MSRRESLNKSKQKEEEEIFYAPEHEAKFGSDPNMIFKTHLDEKTVKHISISNDNEELRYLVICILDNCIDQIHILCGGRSGCDPLAFFEDVLKKRYTESKSLLFEPIYDRDTGEPFNVSFIKTRLNKPYNDGEKLKEFLTEVKNELNDFHAYQLFRDMINNVKVKKREAQILLNQSIENQIKMKELKDAVVTQGRDSVLQIQKFNRDYAAACDSYEELLVLNLIQLRYATMYENSRFEQNQIKCDREIREIQNFISKYKIKIDNEARVHEEILRFIDENQKDIKGNIKIWIKKYNIDMERHHFLVLQIKDHLDDVKKLKHDLKIKFMDHKKAIKNFKEYKEKKRIIMERREKIIKATIKIQAWWRGIMCRRNLRSGQDEKSKMEKQKGKQKEKKRKQKAEKAAKEMKSSIWDYDFF